MQAEAVILEKPGALRVGTVALKEPGAGDVVVDMIYSGVSTGTERLFFEGTMPAFPGFGYPLVPGYEGVGEVVAAGSEAAVDIGSRVFVPGANCFEDARGLFGATASRVVVSAARAVPVSPDLGARAALLSLAATAEHAIAASPNAGPTLIVGHGVLGRLMARLMIARGDDAPTVWETNPDRRAGALGYNVACAQTDATSDYATIFDVSGDARIIDAVSSRLRRNGEIVLAGFYAQPVSFAFAPAFMREARFRIAAEWQPDDLTRVSTRIAEGALSLDGLISHRAPARTAGEAYAKSFTDPACTKMILDWRN